MALMLLGTWGNSWYHGIDPWRRSWWLIIIDSDRRCPKKIGVINDDHLIDISQILGQDDGKHHPKLGLNFTNMLQFCKHFDDLVKIIYQ